MRQAKELGSNNLSSSAATCRSGAGDGGQELGGRRHGLLPSYRICRVEGAGHGQVGSRLEEGLPNAPAGRPNNFDLLAYGDMYVLAEGMKRRGPTLTADD